MHTLTHSVMLTLLLCLFSTAQADSLATVVTMSNSADGNSVMIFEHNPGQGLVQTASVDAGGNGSGAGLGNQGALALSSDRQWVFAVNAGSNSIAAIDLKSQTLSAVSDSHGLQPVSLTLHHNLLYVLNAGSDSIAGFRVRGDGSLSYIEGSSRSLSGSGVGAAQISFTPTGDMLVVTEKATNKISVFPLDYHQSPEAIVVNNSVGATPFGFSFDRFGHLLVTEAEGGAADASTVSAYSIAANGHLIVRDGAVATTESAACWLATTRNGRIAFTTNTASSSISALRVNRFGKLQLLHSDGVAASTGEGTAPIDLALSDSGRFVYALSANAGVISAFVISNQSLVSLPGTSGLPTSTNGLVAF